MKGTLTNLLLLISVVCTMHMRMSAQQVIEELTFTFDDPNKGGFSPSAVNIDDTGFFGIRNGALEINDIEGRQCTPPASITNGDNSNFGVLLSDPTLQAYCDVSIEVKVRLSNAEFESCISPGRLNVIGCSDLAGREPGGDGFIIRILLNGNEVIAGGYCGNNPEGSFSVSGLDARIGSVLQITITGGTQAVDESYYIDEILVKGNPRSFVGANIVASNTTLCAGREPIILSETGENITHTWYKDDVLIAQNTPFYQSGLVQLSDAGIYRVDVIEAGGCTSSDEIEITVQECLMVPDFVFDSIYCQTDTLILPAQAPNGTKGRWVQESPISLSDSLGEVTLSFFSEDRMFYDFMINVQSATRTTIDTTICPADVLMINENIYSIANPSGQEVISTGSGCDSIIDINLTFYAQDTVDQHFTLCPGEVTFFQGIPITTDLNNAILTAGPNLCDTLYRLTVSAELNDTSQIVVPLCQGLDTVVRGRPLNTIDLLTDTLRIPKATCGDSIIILSVMPQLDTVIFINRTICPDEHVTIAGQVFNADRPIGDIILQRESGCDSVINVNLDVIEPLRIPAGITLCEGDISSFRGLLIDGSETSITYPTGPNGCDTIYFINVTVIPTDTLESIIPLCPGQDTIIAGQLLNTTTNTEIILEAQNNSCILYTRITAMPLESSSLTFGDTLCFEDFLMISDQIFDRNNRSGSVIIPNSAGCDSTIEVSLFFQNQINISIDTALCHGDTYNQYGISAQAPFDTIISRSSSDCDSIISIFLEAKNDVFTLINDTICPDQIVTVGTSVFNSANPTGELVLSSQNGCDSTINVNLEIIEPVTSPLSITLCEGETTDFRGLPIDGTITTISVNEGPNGCDTLYEIDVIVIPADTLDNIIPLCAGQDTMIAGQLLNTTTNTEIIIEAQNSSCILYTRFIAEVLAPSNSVVSGTLCFEDFVTVSDQVFDRNNPNGIVVIPNVAGCDSTIEVSLSFQDQINITIDTALCLGDTFSRFGVLAFAPFDTIIHRNGRGCDSMISIALDEIASPDIEIMADTLTCDVPMTDLVVTPSDQILGWTGPNEYSTNEPAPTVTQHGQYFVSIEESGCIFLDSIVVVTDDEPPSLDVPSTVSLCGVSSISIAAVTDADMIEWYTNNALISSDMMLTVTAPGLYEVIATARNGCTSMTTMTVSTEPEITILSTLIGDNRYRLTFDRNSGIDSITWYTASDLIYCTDCDEIFVDITDTTIFSLTTVDQNGCRAMDMITLLPSTFAPPSSIPKVYFPNVFNPNGQLLNSRFYASSNRAELIYDMDIKDRWGNRMYSIQSAIASDHIQGWDGTTNGKSASPGIYTYVAKVYNGTSKPQVVSGTLLLVY